MLARGDASQSRLRSQNGGQPHNVGRRCPLQLLRQSVAETFRRATPGGTQNFAIERGSPAVERDPEFGRNLPGMDVTVPLKSAVIAGVVFGLALADLGNADVLMSKSHNTWCEYQPGGAIRVQCTAADWTTQGGSARKTFVLKTTGKASLKTLVGDPGEGIPVPYNRWLYFRGGTARFNGSTRDLRCIWRKTGLTCRNRSDHGFKLRLGYHHSF
jgi:hypothetical protein